MFLLEYNGKCYDWAARQTLSNERSITGSKLATWFESLKATVIASGIKPLK